MAEISQGDALAAIAAEDPNALKLVGDLMAYNARSLGWTMEQLYLGEKAAHERTKERLDAALDRIDLMERRFDWLRGGPDTEWMPA